MNSVLIVEWNGNTYEFPANWVDLQVIVDEEVVDDFYGGGKFEDQWDARTFPNFSIRHNETGQESRVTFEDEIWEFFSHEPAKI